MPGGRRRSRWTSLTVGAPATRRRAGRRTARRGRAAAAGPGWAAAVSACSEAASTAASCAGRPAASRARAEPGERVPGTGLRRSRPGPGRRAATVVDVGPGDQLGRALEQDGRAGAVGPGADGARAGRPRPRTARRPSSRASSPACGVSSQVPGQPVGPVGRARRRRARPGSPESTASATDRVAVGPVAPAGAEQVGLHPAGREDDVGQVRGDQSRRGLPAPGTGPCRPRRRPRRTSP